MLSNRDDDLFADPPGEQGGDDDDACLAHLFQSDDEEDVANAAKGSMDNDDGSDDGCLVIGNGDACARLSSSSSSSSSDSPSAPPKAKKAKSKAKSKAKNKNKTVAAELLDEDKGVALKDLSHKAPFGCFLRQYWPAREAFPFWQAILPHDWVDDAEVPRHTKSLRVREHLRTDEEAIDELLVWLHCYGT